MHPAFLPLLLLLGEVETMTSVAYLQLPLPSSTLREPGGTKSRTLASLAPGDIDRTFVAS